MNRRSEEHTVVIAGRRAAEELLRAAPNRVRSIALQSSAKFSGKLQGLIERVPAEVKYAAEPSELDQLAEGANHQGIVILAEPSGEPSLEELLSVKGTDLLVVLDEISDPHNLGAVLRACEGAGAGGVIIPERRSAPLSPVARKASAGASEHLAIVRVKNLQRALSTVKQAGFWVVGAALAPGSHELGSYLFPEKVAVIFGSEGKGMRQLTMRECDELVMIPMYGRVASLNVSQAAAIVMYELRRQRRG
jgi:23S rRNA (guanosine2251-2'-O)-methyltransferase